MTIFPEVMISRFLKAELDIPNSGFDEAWLCYSTNYILLSCVYYTQISTLSLEINQVTLAL